MAINHIHLFDQRCKPEQKKESVSCGETDQEKSENAVTYYYCAASYYLIHSHAVLELIFTRAKEFTESCEQHIVAQWLWN